MKTQYLTFTTEALPTLFHTQTEEFCRYVKKDAMDFFRFWWNQVGSKVDHPQPEWIDDIQVELLETHNPVSESMLLRLPVPPAGTVDKIDWLWFVCLKRHPLASLLSPSKRVLLCRSQVPATPGRIFEITPRLRQVALPKSIAPEAGSVNAETLSALLRS